MQNIDSVSATIMWETDNTGDGYVDWGDSPFSLNNTVTSSSVSGSGNSRIHTASISSLVNDMKYYYQVRTATGQESFVYNLKTTKKNNSEYNLCLVAMSDMQRDGSNPNVFEDIIEQGVIPVIDTANTGILSELINGILIPGDLVPSGNNFQHWRDYFFAKADSLMPYVPTYPVLGNHEYYGNGEENFLKYFSLPENGSSSNLEEWWYKDLSNVRIIGMNTNSGASDQDTQLVWLQNVLDEACLDSLVDFVFCQFHHPHKSELWTPGESDFSGEIIAKLESFSTTCGKPSIHLYGHTHGYSRGQTRDHNHLWVNVATAGGNIDYWGEFSNADYEEFTKSQDEYGFVLLKVEAGSDPKFKLTRYSRGDEAVPLTNEVRDEITVKRYDSIPNRPMILYPFYDTINPNCFTLKAGEFSDPLGDTIQAAHWQISSDSLDWDSALVYESWKQSENWYNEVNTQAGDDLTNEYVDAGLNPGQEYYWRVRYRDEHLSWSDWSGFAVLFTNNVNNAVLSGNLVMNNGAENGIQNWTGDIEDLISNECNSVPVYAGSKMFAVGGICQNESAYGKAEQNIDVTAFTSNIQGGNIFARYEAYMRDYSGSDIPSIKLEFLDSLDNIILTSSSISNKSPTWKKKSATAFVPINTKSINFILEGFRNAGSDNDSYFDEISLVLEEGQSCSEYDPCLITRIVDYNIYNKSYLAEAKDTIISNSHISGNSLIRFSALKEVNLNIGFEVQAPSVFEILLDDCNN